MIGGPLALRENHHGTTLMHSKGTKAVYMRKS